MAASSFALLNVLTQTVVPLARGISPWAFDSAERVWMALLVTTLLVSLRSHRGAEDAPIPDPRQKAG